MKIIKQNKIRFFQKSARALALIALFLMPFLFLPSNTYALTDEQRLNQTNQQLNEANKQLKDTQAQKRTLQGDVAYYNSQISNAQTKINSLTGQISQLDSEILNIEKEIVNAEIELKRNRTNLGENMRIFYEEGQTSTLELIAQSNHFSDFVDRSEYLQVMQLKVKDSADKVVVLMNELNTKKQNLAEKKKSTEAFKNEQVVQKNQLASQKSIKDQLLAETKGDEAAYQTLVKKLQSQVAALQSAIWSKNNGGNYVSLGTVHAGDIIGYIGNSGYSTGCHLHFEIRNQNQSHQNPSSYIGNGYYVNPAPGVRINVGYGYSSDYFPGVFHTGIDMADGCRGTAVRATADGDIIKRVSGRPNTYPWSLEYGNYVMIKHSNGWFSLYGHLR